MKAFDKKINSTNEAYKSRSRDFFSFSLPSPPVQLKPCYLPFVDNGKCCILVLSMRLNKLFDGCRLILVIDALLFEFLINELQEIAQELL